MGAGVLDRVVKVFIIDLYKGAPAAQFSLTSKDWSAAPRNGCLAAP